MLQWVHTETQGLVKVNCLPSYICLMLISLCYVLRLCHSFQDCSLNSQPLFQLGPNVGPSKENGQLILKRPKFPKGFQGRVFKDRVKKRASGYVISSWTFFWLVGDESASSTFWFQTVWVLYACGQHIVNFFHIMGVSIFVKQLKKYDSKFYL